MPPATSWISFLLLRTVCVRLKAGKFNLAAGDRHELIEKPVIQGPVVLELEGAYRRSYLFQRI